MLIWKPPPKYTLFEKKSDDEFYRIFMAIIKKSGKNNTYKFAMARFLLEYSKSEYSKSDPISYKVDYKELAECFLKYYWSHVCKSKLRQGPKNQVPKIVDIIKKKFGDDVYPFDFECLKNSEPDKFEDCTRDIMKKCFDNVVPRFQWIEGRKQLVFYKYKAKEYHDSARNEKLCLDTKMQINEAAVEFFSKNFEQLYNSVILEWVKFLESKNFGAPNLTKKVEAEVKGKRDQRKFLEILRPFVDRCFYCDEELKFDEKTHVDHVIPYDYVGDTELWNAVLACQKCNCAKLDRLPPKKFVDDLLAQNQKCYSEIKGLRESIDRIHHIGTESLISEDAIKALKHIVEWHYQNAASAGYPKMHKFPCEQMEHAALLEAKSVDRAPRL